jgi:ABC-type Mn2+/Zn2+ transport system ATPase subunit
VTDSTTDDDTPRDTVLVEVRGATFGYGERPVVRVDELHLRAGRSLGIFGPNGAGKTTLVRGVTGLLPPMAGEVIRNPPADLRDAEPGPRFGYLPQHRTMELHWPMSGLDAAAMASSARGRLGRITRDNERRIHDAMRRLGVADLARRPFSRLSGGQQQRLLLAGALAAEPNILVLDEPTDGLDVRSRETLLSLLRDLTAAGGLCTAIISHEVEDLLSLCDEIAWLHAADDPDHPSRVEVIAPERLAERMLATSRSQEAARHG